MIRLQVNRIPRVATINNREIFLQIVRVFTVNNILLNAILLNLPHTKTNLKLEIHINPKLFTKCNFREYRGDQNETEFPLCRSIFSCLFMNIQQLRTMNQVEYSITGPNLDQGWVHV